MELTQTEIRSQSVLIKLAKRRISLAAEEKQKQTTNNQDLTPYKP